MIILTGPIEVQSRDDRRLVPHTETSSKNESSELPNSHTLMINPDPSNDEFTLVTAASLQAYIDKEFPESWHSPTSTSDWLTPKPFEGKPLTSYFIHKRPIRPRRSLGPQLVPDR